VAEKEKISTRNRKCFRFQELCCELFGKKCGAKMIQKLAFGEDGVIICEGSKLESLDSWNHSYAVCATGVFVFLSSGKPCRLQQ